MRTVVSKRPSPCERSDARSMLRRDSSTTVASAVGCCVCSVQRRRQLDVVVARTTRRRRRAGRDEAARRGGREASEFRGPTGSGSSSGSCVRPVRRTPFVRFAKSRSPQVGGQFGEEGGGRHDERHVAMPAVPGASFAVIEAKIGLGALETFFDRPAKACRAGKFGERDSRGRKDQILGLLVGVLAIASDQQPALKALFGQPRQFHPRPVIEPEPL